ncbi:MAG: 2Fe-2S iron-sulfur cluster binding domain-containing protein [Alphaproteobacteria bacterium]|nr:2Fe-2S iron-sulfur cluster binding domain-containing protein [Alphaproteobacteria bacterium]
MARLKVNGTPHEFNGDPRMPMLWWLREEASCKGVKFGCGIAQCGACTVHVDGRAVRSCVMPMAAADGVEVTTIEGLAKGEVLHPVQQAWLEEDVAQCGYCQAGQIMAVVDLLSRISDPTDADIDAALTNICRCGTYFRLRKAVHKAARMMRETRG